MKTSIKTIVTTSVMTSLLTFSTISMADSMLGIECSHWKKNVVPVKKLADEGIPEHMVMNVVYHNWRGMPSNNILMMEAIVHAVYEHPTMSMEQVLRSVDTLCKEID